MTTKDLAYYERAFEALRVNKAGRRVAPHKGVLLLAVMDLVERGDVCAPFVPVSGTLERQFKLLWHRWVPATNKYRCTVSYPFFHMASSPFWKLVPLVPGRPLQKEYSTVTALRRDVAGAAIDKELFWQMRTESGRAALRRVIFDNYLPYAEGSITDGLCDCVAEPCE